MNHFETAAAMLLTSEHVQNATSEDLQILAKDLRLISEQEWPKVDSEYTALPAAKLLMSRVRPASLTTYMESLRIQAKRY